MKCCKILMDKGGMKLRNRTCRCCELEFITALCAKDDNSSRRFIAVSGFNNRKIEPYSYSKTNKRDISDRV